MQAVGADGRSIGSGAEHAVFSSQYCRTTSCFDVSSSHTLLHFFPSALSSCRRKHKLEAKEWLKKREHRKTKPRLCDRCQLPRQLLHDRPTSASMKVPDFFVDAVSAFIAEASSVHATSN